MSDDKEKGIKDEDLDNVSGGTGDLRRPTPTPPEPKPPHGPPMPGPGPKSS